MTKKRPHRSGMFHLLSVARSMKEPLFTLHFGSFSWRGGWWPNWADRLLLLLVHLQRVAEVFLKAKVGHQRDGAIGWFWEDEREADLTAAGPGGLEEEVCLLYLRC